jgi:hypothetical protein
VFGPYPSRERFTTRILYAVAKPVPVPGLREALLFDGDDGGCLCQHYFSRLQLVLCVREPELCPAEAVE